MKRAIYLSSCLLVGTLASFVLCEILLRALPIPGLTYFVGKYDDTVGMTFYPHAKMTYLAPNGNNVERDINSSGFPDVEHRQEKAEGVYRIGFFGDSYTEARQVPVDSTFFRVVESDLRGIDSHGVGMLPRYIECMHSG